MGRQNSYRPRRFGLNKAVRSQRIRRLREKFMGIYGMDKNLFLLMLVSRETEDEELVAKLIAYGFKVDTDLHGTSALILSIERRKFAIAELLIRKGCSLSCKTPNGDYPLHLAVHRRNNHLVQVMLNSGADLTSVDSSGKTALHIACELCSEDIAKVLIDRCSEPSLNVADEDGFTPLLYACQYGTKELVQYLLSKGAEVNAKDNYGEISLHKCILSERCCPEMMRILLNAGADVEHKNVTGTTPLISILHRFFDFSISQDRRVSDTYQEMASMLIDHGSNVHVVGIGGQTPLILAINAAQSDILVKKLLNAGSPTDVADYQRLGPLFWACKFKNEKILDLLINGGADFQNDEWIVINKTFQFPNYSQRRRPALDFVMKRKREVRSLSYLCRIVIRRQFSQSIEKNVKYLPIPKSLAKYILDIDQ